MSLINARTSEVSFLQATACPNWQLIAIDGVNKSESQSHTTNHLGLDNLFDVSEIHLVVSWCLHYSNSLAKKVSLSVSWLDDCHR